MLQVERGQFLIRHSSDDRVKARFDKGKLAFAKRCSDAGEPNLHTSEWRIRRAKWKHERLVIGARVEPCSNAYGSLVFVMFRQFHQVSVTGTKRYLIFLVEADPGRIKSRGLERKLCSPCSTLRAPILKSELGPLWTRSTCPCLRTLRSIRSEKMRFPSRRNILEYTSGLGGTDRKHCSSTGDFHDSVTH
jgi:hypothetical protein